MQNPFEFRGDHVAILLRRRDGSYLETLIDTEDLPIAESMPRWCAQAVRRAGTYYVINTYATGSTVYLHRLITGAPDNMEVDHKNHNPLDNRRENLNVCTRSENASNRSGANRNSKTGALGVRVKYTADGTPRWVAQIAQGGRCVQLGTFATIEEAIKARAAHVALLYEMTG